jgi:hypothetical protein
MVEHELVKALRAKLEETLFSNLTLLQKRGTDQSLLAEDLNIERNRRDLTNKKEKLLEIRCKLNTFSLT